MKTKIKSISGQMLLGQHLIGEMSSIANMSSAIFLLNKSLQSGDNSSKKEAIRSSLLVLSDISGLINSNAGDYIAVPLIVDRLVDNIEKVREEHREGNVNINRFQNILADTFTLAGIAGRNSPSGIIFSGTGVIIGGIALNTGETGVMSTEDFYNSANWWGFAYDRLEAFSKYLYSWFPDKMNPWIELNRDGKFKIYDPLVLDLDGDGIELIGHNKFQGALFDFDANGIKNATGWVKADDGLLVFDKNNNGVIDSGLELFGDATILKDGTKAQHGFMALADLDSNGDGKIDANDADFDKLKIWRDLNGDGISQEGELFTLSELGIQSLNLDYQNINQNLSNGNSLSQIGSFTKTDGTTGKMGDVHFAFDSVYSQYTQPIELTAEQMEVANLKGIGRVRDLRRFVKYIDDNQYVDIKSLQAA